MLLPRRAFTISKCNSLFELQIRFVNLIVKICCRLARQHNLCDSQIRKVIARKINFQRNHIITSSTSTNIIIMLQNILAFMLFDAASSYNFVKRYLQVIRQDAAQTKTFRWRRSARRSSSPQMNGLVFIFRFNVNVSFKFLKTNPQGKWNA